MIVRGKLVLCIFRWDDGATLRFFVQSLFSSFTMLWIVNVVGSFLLGYINGVFNRKKNNAWKFFLTGMLGAFTTFSTFFGLFSLIKGEFS
ncbi:fluoride efflux transporter FluC [Ureibacillus acetophenoni]